MFPQHIIARKRDGHALTREEIGAFVRGATDGFVKLIAERDSHRLIGGACIGPEASELIHEIVVAIRFRATAGELAATPHYHPTLGEIWTYPAAEISEL